MRPFVRHFDKAVANSIIAWPASLHPFFLLITTLGHPVVIVSIGAGIVYWGRTQSNVRLSLSGAAIWVTLGVGSLLKYVFGRSRPLTEYAANIWYDHLSFPSGHTTGSTIAYGLLAYFAWQLLPQPWNYIMAAILLLLIMAIGVSRVYLGAHFPSDVIAGWLLGGMALFAVIIVIAPLSGK